MHTMRRIRAAVAEGHADAAATLAQLSDEARAAERRHDLLHSAASALNAGMFLQ